MKKYMNREWLWWIKMNGHYCHFCRENRVTKGHPDYGKNPMAHEISIGSMVFDRYHLGQYNSGYVKRLYQMWLEHMKQYHPEILKNSTIGV